MLTLSDATGWKLAARQDVLDQLLARYVDVNDPLFSRTGLGSGEGYPSMPAAWNQSYRKLEKLLRAYRKEGPLVARGETLVKPYWHLASFYLWRRVRLVYGCRGCGEVGARNDWHKHRGQRFRTDERILQAFRHEELSLGAVGAGLLWLDEAWTVTAPHIGEPFLPDEMLAQGTRDAIAA